MEKENCFSLMEATMTDNGKKIWWKYVTEMWDQLGWNFNDCVLLGSRDTHDCIWWQICWQLCRWLSQNFILFSNHEHILLIMTFSRESTSRRGKYDICQWRCLRRGMWHLSPPVILFFLLTVSFQEWQFGLPHGAGTLIQKAEGFSYVGEFKVWCCWLLVGFSSVFWYLIGLGRSI